VKGKEPVRTDSLDRLGPRVDEDLVILPRSILSGQLGCLGRTVPRGNCVVQRQVPMIVFYSEGHGVQLDHEFEAAAGFTMVLLTPFRQEIHGAQRTPFGGGAVEWEPPILGSNID
jgi:hypothetical protein